MLRQSIRGHKIILFFICWWYDSANGGIKLSFFNLSMLRQYWQWHTNVFKFVDLTIARGTKKCSQFFQFRLLGLIFINNFKYFEKLLFISVSFVSLTVIFLTIYSVFKAFVHNRSTFFSVCISGSTIHSVFTILL